MRQKALYAWRLNSSGSTTVPAGASAANFWASVDLGDSTYPAVNSNGREFKVVILFDSASAGTSVNWQVAESAASASGATAIAGASATTGSTAGIQEIHAKTNKRYISLYCPTVTGSYGYAGAIALVELKNSQT